MIYFTLVIYVTRVYVIRHPETDGNAKKIFQGHIDLDVNELGKKQLAALKERFENINIDAVYTSPLLRTRRTAEAVVGCRNIPIIPHEGLIELNGGVYEAKTFFQIGEEYPDFPDIWSNHPWDFAPRNGEKMTDAYNRIWKTVKNIVCENKGKDIAVTTHGGVIRCLMCRLFKNDITKLTEIPFMYNTSVSLLEFDGKMNVNVVYFNDYSHLTDDLKNTNAEVPK